jgi:hypothetical protein
VRPGGTVFVCVWALEQAARTFDAQDVMVPWHMQQRYTKASAPPAPPVAAAAAAAAAAPAEPVYQRCAARGLAVRGLCLTARPPDARYYHMFRQGELEALAAGVRGVRVLQGGYERDNWWAVLGKQPADA